MYARVPQAMTQNVLKIEKLTHIMGTAPILEIARAYVLRPRLWLRGMRHKETRPACYGVILFYCSVRDWKRFCYAIDQTHPSTLCWIRYRFIFLFSLWRADLKMSRFVVEFARCVWTEAVSGKKQPADSKMSGYELNVTELILVTLQFRGFFCTFRVGWHFPLLLVFPWLTKFTISSHFYLKMFSL